MTRKPQPLRLHVPPDLQPVYANLARIGHTPVEFVLDLAQFLPGDTEARLLARVVMSPQAVKMLYQALGENLAKYEASFGEIALPHPSSLADLLFRPPSSPSPPSGPPAPEEK